MRQICVVVVCCVCVLFCKKTTGYNDWILPRERERKRQRRSPMMSPSRSPLWALSLSLCLSRRRAALVLCLSSVVFFPSKFANK